MTISKVAEVLNGSVVAGDASSDRAVGAVVASDLMSDVLLVDAEEMLLLSSLASDQVLRTAHVVGAMGVVIHDSKPLPASMLAVSAQLNIPLVSSPLSKYESCVKIHEALEAEKANG